MNPTGADVLIIAATFFLALFLAVLPLPEWAAAWRPAWVAMVLVYWCMTLPERVGVGTGWLIGLLLDALHGTPLGQNAAALAIAAYVSAKNYRRLRLFPVAQQALWVGLMILRQCAPDVVGPGIPGSRGGPGLLLVAGPDQHAPLAVGVPGVERGAAPLCRALRVCERTAQRPAQTPDPARW